MNRLNRLIRSIVLPVCALLGAAGPVSAQYAPDGNAHPDTQLVTELAGREERRIKVMLKGSKIPTGQTLENFDFAFQPAIERSRIETLATGRGQAIARAGSS